MPRTPSKSRKSGIRQRVVAKREVLARFTDEQLEAMERRASRDIPQAELRELEAAAEAAYERVRSVEAMLKALRAARVRRGISQTEIDRMTGIGRANISRLENLHLDNPTFDTLLRYAQAVGMKVTLQPSG